MFQKEVYIERRAKLAGLMNDGIALFLGNPDAPMNYPANIYKFRQDSDFAYFFGIDHPNFAGIVDLDEGKNIIFGNDVSLDDIIWMGPQPSVKDQAAEFGITETYNFKALFDYVAEAKAKGRKIHFLPPYRAENKILLQQLTGISVLDVNANRSEELVKAVVEIRSIKDQYEIAHLDEIMDVAYLMHTSAMKMAHEGVWEREVAGRIEGIALENGGRVSFPVILSKRGETLHNHYHGNLLKTGDLMLTDAGFESPWYYATDHTRTSPVGGKFSQKQKEIYQIVLDANNNVNAASKPGIPYREMHYLAARTITNGLKDLGLMKGDTEEAVKAGAHAMFMPHGLGHMMGMDVHDMEGLGENYVGYDEKIQRSTQFGTAFLRLGRELQEGFVLTNEPGIYFIPALIDKWKNEKINNEFINFDKVNEYRTFGGIRLEDDLLITKDGNRLLGKKRIPIEVDEVEAMIQSK
jgi:Xaa-Pro aminopeptidase